MRRLIATALAKGSAERPSAEALGRALDQWCADQGTPGTPDRLQAPAPGRSVPRTNSGR